jgi:hypothetical protein
MILPLVHQRNGEFTQRRVNIIHILFVQDRLSYKLKSLHQMKNFNPLTFSLWALHLDVWGGDDSMRINRVSKWRSLLLSLWSFSKAIRSIAWTNLVDLQQTVLPAIWKCCHPASRATSKLKVDHYFESRLLPIFQGLLRLPSDWLCENFFYQLTEGSFLTLLTIKTLLRLLLPLNEQICCSFRRECSCPQTR